MAGEKRDRAHASDAAPIERIEVAAYTIPTDGRESDGTLEWDETTLVVVHARAAGARGVGYTYADVAAAKLVHGKLADAARSPTGRGRERVRDVRKARVRSAVRTTSRDGGGAPEGVTGPGANGRA
jgi:hypothetical protein